MPTPKRRIEPALIERLFREPYRFDYFQAVRILERWLRRRGAAKPDAVRPLAGRQDLIGEYLRFENSTSLGFPASQLEAIATEPRTIAHDARALETALHDEALQAIRVRPAFMGLLSAQGVLPAHYTERIAEHELHHKDDGPRAFLDTLSNRSLGLFYAAWKKYRVALHYQDDDEDRFLPLLLDLSGLGRDTGRPRAHAGAKASQPGAGMPQAAAIGYFAAPIRHRPVSAVQIARVLSEYFNQRVQAEQFIGNWYTIPPAQQSALGSATATLGQSALAGARVWQRDLRLRLIVGPLNATAFADFLPGGQSSNTLRSWLTLFTGLSLEYEVELVLRAADVRSVTLGDDDAGRVGWNAYLVDGPQDRDRCDVRYDVQFG